MSAKGFPHKNKLRLVCSFDPDMFEEILGANIPGCDSTAAKIRTLVEWGLEQLGEEDAAPKTG